MSLEAAFSAAVLARLSDDAGVKAALGDPARVFDRAPGGAAFPFLSLGRAETEPAADDALMLHDHRLTLHIRGRREDRDVLKEALHAVRAALTGPAPALDAPWRCVLCRVVYADLFTGPDGRSLQGLLRVRALVEG